MLVDQASVSACRARRDRLVVDLGVGAEEAEAPRCVGMRLRGAVRGVGPAERLGITRMVESADEVGMFPLLWHAQNQASPQSGDLGTRLAIAVSTYAGERIEALERLRSRAGRGQGQARRSQAYGAGSDSRR